MILDLLNTMFGPDLFYDKDMFDFFIKGDRLIKELFLALEPRMGDLLVLIRAELFYDMILEEESFWDLKKMRAGVVAFFFDEEKPLSEGKLDPSIDCWNMSWWMGLTNF
jgi:hypothetical protein